MSIIDLIKTSLYSIKAHKLRVFLTMIGIIIGISSTVTVKSIGDGLSDYVSKSMESTNSNKYQVNFEPENEEAYYMNWFEDYDINDLKSINGVTEVETMTNLGTNYFQTLNITFFNKTTFAILTSPIGNVDMQYGRDITESDEGKNRIVINQEVAEALFDTVESAIGKGVSFNGETYEVIGVTKSSTNFKYYMASMYCFIPKENLQSMNSSNDYISAIYVHVDPKYDKDKVLNEVTETLKKNHTSMDGEYKVQDSSEEVEILTTMIGAITTFVSAITGIALFVGGVGVMNIMYVSVTERKREIGIRRAIGAKPRTILFQFLFEAIIVTGVGGIIGIVIGYALGSIVSAFIPIEGFKAVLTAKTLIGSASISIFVGIIFGIIPARNASKMDPIKAIYQ